MKTLASIFYLQLNLHFGKHPHQYTEKQIEESNLHNRSPFSQLLLRLLSMLIFFIRVYRGNFKNFFALFFIWDETSQRGHTLDKKLGAVVDISYEDRYLKFYV